MVPFSASLDFGVSTRSYNLNKCLRDAIAQSGGLTWEGDVQVKSLIWFLEVHRQARRLAEEGANISHQVLALHCDRLKSVFQDAMTSD